MSQNKSLKKRIKITKRNSLKNKYYKTSIKNLTKTLLKLLEVSDGQTFDSQYEKKVKKILNLIYCILDKGNKKNVFHKNYVARKKSQWALRCLNKFQLEQKN